MAASIDLSKRESEVYNGVVEMEKQEKTGEWSAENGRAYQSRQELWYKSEPVCLSYIYI